MKKLPTEKNKTLLIIIVAIFLSNIFTAVFWNTYYVQIPWVVTWRSFIVSRNKTKEVAKPIKKLTVVTKEAVASENVTKYTLEQETAYDTVWFNESNRGNDKSGLHGDCLKKGMINEIGYAPGQGICFKDRTDQKDTFMLWLNNRLNHVKTPYCNTIRQCILYYTNNSYTI